MGSGRIRTLEDAAPERSEGDRLPPVRIRFRQGCNSPAGVSSLVIFMIRAVPGAIPEWHIVPRTSGFAASGPEEPSGAVDRSFHSSEW